MSLAFLNTKSFHPKTRENQKKLWIAEEKAKHEERMQRELREQYEKEREREQNMALNRRSKGKAATTQDKRQPLKFMYEPPPGFADPKKGDKEAEPKTHTHTPQLEGAYAKNVETKSKPFGYEVKSVRCARCKEWGHAMGDRECKGAQASVSVDRHRQGDVMSRTTTGLRGTQFVLKGNAGYRAERADTLVDDLVSSGEDTEEEEIAIAQEVFGGLAKKQRRKLLKQYIELKDLPLNVAKERIWAHVERRASVTKKKKHSRRRDSSSESSSSSSSSSYSR